MKESSDGETLIAVGIRFQISGAAEKARLPKSIFTARCYASTLCHSMSSVCPSVSLSVCRSIRLRRSGMFSRNSSSERFLLYRTFFHIPELSLISFRITSKYVKNERNKNAKRRIR